jgi:eukaryotic-like serine/threonine-protein kinase
MTPPSPPSPPAGDPRDGAAPKPLILDHELLRRVGRGGYGDVWLGRNIMGVWRAIKVVYRDRFEDARPFEREFAGIQRFEPISRSHPSQVNILHIGRNEAEGYFYYVMELADDQARGQEIDPDTYAPRTIKSELMLRERLPFAECLGIAHDLALALEHLHTHHLVHRDTEPRLWPPPRQRIFTKPRSAPRIPPQARQCGR